MSPNPDVVGPTVVDAFEGGFGWLARSEESLQRCSHALRTDDGLWLLDPLDAPGLDAQLGARSGDDSSRDGGSPDEDGDSPIVAGVAVCSGWHARDAGVIAARHDVPVSVPAWMDRPLEHLDAPAGDETGPDVTRFEGHLPGTDVAVERVSPMGLWDEAVCWRERDRTLYVPESLGTAETFTVGDERLGVSIYARLAPPRAALAEYDPERVLVGHGTGIFEDADAALKGALAGSRRRFPRMLLEHGPQSVRELLAAVRR